MLVDPGADECFFSDQLAYTFGLNPFDGSAFSAVGTIDAKQTTAIFPVVAEFPQLGIEMEIERANFTQLRKGWNGLLGHGGFLNHFESVTFFPGNCVDMVLRNPPRLGTSVRPIVYT